MQHVVTRPTPPFSSADGRLTVHQVPAWVDNLIWLIVCNETGETAVVDGPEAGPVLDYCAAHGLRLTTILNTHTHGDHIGINHDLQRRGKLEGLVVVGPSRRAADVPGLTRGVDDGDTARVGAVEGRVMLTEGHIDGHVSYVFGDLLLCGDTLFAGGCGRLFDGPPAKMHDSLRRLAALPEPTRVCCAHEYTQDNLRFAWSLEPGNEALAERIRDAWALRAEGGCTVPSTIGLERATNPFLRGNAPELLASLRAAVPGVPLDEPVEVFAATRRLKDLGDYKQRGDEGLPLS
ncbi:hydroxyacylglutathione hydrolase [Paraliomyxa miuraensis]|uniref:hydroxyacylglutathione hydrolase n=1 Tax=Paraliomyxa miuraensis TaxID=376150 RepID=UPI00225868B0|nr:hydroxyacylglutathione hydrolase [Paraliomyxa miuraensis]MCX4242056.1 hydroxyacylglutathione hydrolase [Paraliomyxa miuraensis]